MRRKKRRLSRNEPRPESDFWWPSRGLGGGAREHSPLTILTPPAVVLWLRAESGVEVPDSGEVCTSDVVILARERDRMACRCTESISRVSSSKRTACSSHFFSSSRSLDYDTSREEIKVNKTQFFHFKVLKNHRGRKKHALIISWYNFRSIDWLIDWLTQRIFLSIKSISICQ